ncbi:MAG: hypothetical protein KTR24_12905 [Saprospiraceae bacterium]|nr:hypothetical protein [Saprospiraceae bacterium]
MRGPNDYQELRQNVDLILDRALTQEAQDEMMKKVEGDPEFAQMMNKERNFREFVRKNVTRPKVTPEFIQSIKDQVRFPH